MQELNIGGYSNVSDMLKSNRELKFEYDLLDKYDKKIGTLSDVKCSISLSADAEIKKVASFTLNEKDTKDINFLSEKIKPYYCLKVNDEWLRWSQGIFLLNSPNRTELEGGIYREIEAYDKTLILKEDKIVDRLFLKEGTAYTDAVRNLITSTGITKLSIEESTLLLSVDKEYEIGTSKLEIINDLLNAINYYSVYFDNDGFCCIRKYINPKDRIYEYEYVTDKKSIVEYGASETFDFFGVPNKFVRYVQNPESNYLISTFTNDKASNKLSTVSRGRTITDIQAVNDIADQVTLNEYVRKVATEKSQVYGGYKFTSIIMPNHTVWDCLYIRNNELGISEKVIETSWSMDLDINAPMKHTTKKVVELW